MLSFPTVHAITDALLHAQAAAARVGWQSPPTLLALRGPTSDSDTPRLVTAQLPVQPEQWAHPDGLTGALADITASLRTPAALAVLTHVHTTTPNTRIVAWALLYDDLVIDSDHGGEIRTVDAVDLDGRLYRLTRLRDNDQVVVLVDDGPAPDGDPPTRAHLADLLHTTSLPTTGHRAPQEQPQR